MLAGERERVRTQRMVQQNAKSDGPGDQEGLGRIWIILKITCSFIPPLEPP